MIDFKIPLVPGPTQLSPAVLPSYQKNFGSPDQDSEFFECYANTTSNLRRIMHTEHDVACLSGEGMLALWAALKSTIAPGDRVVAVANGLYGTAIGEMAQKIGADVQFVNYDMRRAADNLELIEAAIINHQPKILTVVHCETPTGILNPIEQIGELKELHKVPLYYVDAVSSLGATEVRVDDWNIDLCLGASQKVLSSYADLAFLSISQAAWRLIDHLDYVGYDALKPFQIALETGVFPYTPNWHGIDALGQAAQALLDEGLDRVYLRHAECAAYCRKVLRDNHLTLVAKNEGDCAPTVTAFYKPEGIGAQDFEEALRTQGVNLGHNLGPLDHSVYRFGHMGSQATLPNVEAGLSGLVAVCEQLKMAEV